ncbi:MAG: response regulator transcription factor [Chloroflexi bacterium]|nr:MAG: response regulator transcription factor [Chloroflexota bacterium]
MGKHTVAIVDDQFDIREMLAIRLQIVKDLEVVGVAANAAQAIGLARTLKPDLMTLDLEMPRIGGAESIPLLRAAAPEMRIVVYSAHLAVVDLTNEKRPDAIVTKSSHLTDLVATILNLLSKGSARSVGVSATISS